MGFGRQCSTTVPVRAPKWRMAAAAASMLLCGVAVAQNADLAVEKIADPVLPGDPQDYTVNVGNFGPETAFNVVLTDVLPPGSSLDSVTPSAPFTCTETSGVLVCTAAEVQPGTTTTITYTVTLVGQGDFVNQATVRQQGCETDFTLNTATSLAVADNVDPSSTTLLITKTDSPDPAAVNAPITYTVLVSNVGNETAFDVVIADTLPSGFIVDSAIPTAGSATVSNGVVLAGVGDIAPSGSAAVTITARSQNAGVFPNVAGVASATASDLPLITNSDTEFTTVLGTTTTLCDMVDLQTTKTGSPGTVNIGETITYVVTAGNNGPETANNVVITDTLPANATFVSAVQSKGTVGFSPGPPAQVINNVGTLDPGEIVTLTITMTAASAGPATNSATITSDETDSNPANNASAATVTISAAPTADLQTSKTVNTTSVNQGAPFIYTITVTNNGPSPATGVVVTDQFAATVTATPNAPSQGSTTGSGVGALVTWNVGTLASGASATLTVTVVGNTPGVVNNSATATGNEIDTVPGNNTAAAPPVTVNPLIASADLQVTKVASTTTVTAGQNVTFTITTRNNGPDAASNVETTDLLQPGLTLISATSPVGTVVITPIGPSTLVEHNIGTLNSGQQAVLTIVVRADTPGGIENTANTVGDQADPNPANNASTALVAVVPAAGVVDVAVTKDVSTTSVQVGQVFTYTVVTRNNGPGTATGVIVTDVLSPSLTFIGASSTDGTVTSSTFAGQTTVINNIGDLGPGQSSVLTIVVAANAPGVIGNSATATSNQADTNPSNDTGVAPLVTVVGAGPSTDLAIVKTVSSTNVSVGNTFIYSIDVTNVSGTTATNVTIFDQLPSNVVFVSEVHSQGTVTTTTVTSNTTVVNNVGTLGPGESASLVITVQAAEAGTANNTATVTSDEPDTNPFNNTTNAPGVTITQTPGGGGGPGQGADVSLTKTANPSPAGQGGTLTFTITATNLGPLTATGVVITDPIPAGTTLVQATSTQGVVSVANGVVTNNVGSLANGAAATLTIVVSPQNQGTLVNTAIVNTSSTDPTVSNNTASVTVVVGPPGTGAPGSADLSVSIQQRVECSPVITGVITNGGPSTATNVKVTLTADTSVTVLSITPSQGAVAGGVADLGSLAPGGSATVTFVVNAPSTARFELSVAATADQFDPNAANNTAVAVLSGQLFIVGPNDASSNVDLQGQWKNPVLNKKGKFKGKLRLINALAGEVAQVNVEFYVSDDDVIDCGDRLFDTRTAKKIKPSTSFDSKKGKSVKPRKKALKSINLSGKFVIAVIDPQNTIVEREESNNVVPTPRL